MRAKAVTAYIAGGKQLPAQIPDQFGHGIARPAGARGARQREHAGRVRCGGWRTWAAERATSKTVRVQYYALLREQAGRSEETLETSAATPAELYAELRQRHPFQLTPEQLNVALNAEFGDWQTPLQHGDTVVFIPPVAGG